MSNLCVLLICLVFLSLPIQGRSVAKEAGVLHFLDSPCKEFTSCEDCAGKGAAGVVYGRVKCAWDVDKACVPAPSASAVGYAFEANQCVDVTSDFSHYRQVEEEKKAANEKRFEPFRPKRLGKMVSKKMPSPSKQEEEQPQTKEIEQEKSTQSTDGEELNDAPLDSNDASNEADQQESEENPLKSTSEESPDEESTDEESSDKESTDKESTAEASNVDVSLKHAETHAQVASYFY